MNKNQDEGFRIINEMQSRFLMSKRKSPKTADVFGANFFQFINFNPTLLSLFLPPSFSLLLSLSVCLLFICFYLILKFVQVYMLHFQIKR